MDLMWEMRQVGVMAFWGSIMIVVCLSVWENWGSRLLPQNAFQTLGRARKTRAQAITIERQCVSAHTPNQTPSI